MHVRKTTDTLRDIRCSKSSTAGASSHSLARNRHTHRHTDAHNQRNACTHTHTTDKPRDLRCSKSLRAAFASLHNPSYNKAHAATTAARPDPFLLCTITTWSLLLCRQESQHSCALSGSIVHITTMLEARHDHLFVCTATRQPMMP